MSEGGKKVVEFFNRMKSKRSNFSNQYEELTTFFLPDRGQITSISSSGTANDPRYVHPANLEVAEKLTSRLISDLTDLALNKMVIVPITDEVGEIDEVKRWCDNVARKLRAIFMNSHTGFQSHNATATADAVVYGTANIAVIEQDMYPYISFKSKHIGRYFVDQDHNNKVDTIVEELKLSVRNIINQFGYENVSSEMRDEYKEEPDCEESIIRVVMPSEDSQIHFGIKEPGNYTLVYVEAETGHVIASYGYTYLPDTVFRWNLKTGEVYGRSPAMTALPYARQLTALSVLENQAYQLAFKPIMLATDDGVLPKTRFVPGQFLPGTIDETTGQRKIDYLAPVSDLNAFRVKEQSLLGLLEKVFYVEQLPDNKNVRMTELEVQARLSQLRSLSPNISRIIGEYLSEVCKKVYHILEKKKLIPTIPDVLKDKQLKFDFMGSLTKSYKVSELEAIQQTYNFMTAAAQYDQTIPQHFDHNKAVRHFAEIAGAPLSIIRDAEEVNAELQAQQQQQAMLAQAQQNNLAAQSISQLQKVQQSGQ